jgi:hypothetical protein
MNRFIKTLGLLIISLFFLSAGINATLDRLAHSSRGNQLAVFDRDGRVVAVYTGDLHELAQDERAMREEQPPLRRSL